MRIIVVAGSKYQNFDSYSYLDGDYFIGIEDGAYEIIKRGFTLNLALGDFDTTTHYNEIINESLKVLKYPKEKDEIDLELALKYIEENCTEIQFPVLIDELLRYSYANKKKFDTVAAFGIALLADEDMMGKTVRMNNQENKFEHFGYYTDDYGRKKFGTIKTTERVENQFGWFVGLDQMYYRKDL